MTITDPVLAGLPAPLVATADDLPPAVAAALVAPAEPGRTTIEAAGIPFHVRSWGAESDPAVLLVHGVTASSGVWWRVGPALAAAGLRIVAPDLPGHGRTGHWTGHRVFRENAADVAALAVAAGIAGPSLRVVGHSWGAMTAAALPAAGLVPARLVLLDPPALSRAAISSMLDDPVERPYDDLAEAIAALGTAYPTWSYGDVVAKAEALTQVDPEAARQVLAENGDWDGGLADLADPAASEVPIRLIRGEPALGGLLPDDVLPAYAARIGAANITTIRGGSHSPMRVRPEATVLALLRALAGEADPGPAGGAG